jgi:hypothetical protein
MAPSALAGGPVTYDAAKKDPSLRQQYIDRMHKEWNNGCVSRMIYDHDGTKIAETMRKQIERMERIGLGPLIDERTRKRAEKGKGCEVAAAGIPANFLDFGKGERFPIYICASLMEENEETFISGIKVHEGTHACDFKEGFRVGKLRFGNREARMMDRRMFGTIMEARAYGNQLKAVPADQWASKHYLFNGTYVLFYVLYETILNWECKQSGMEEHILLLGPDMLKEMKKRVRKQTGSEDKSLLLVRQTLLDYEDVYLEVLDRMDELGDSREKAMRKGINP